MTDIDEDKFRSVVADRLRDAYPEGSVSETVVLPNSRREVDIYVESGGPAPNLAVEVENDFESAFTGHGQASFYAHALDAEPVIILPEGHMEYPEAFYLSTMGVAIFQFPYPDGNE